MDAVQSRGKRHVDPVPGVAQIGIQRLGYRQLRGTGASPRRLVGAGQEQRKADRAGEAREKGHDGIKE